MLQNPRKTLGYTKNMVYKIPPGGEVNHIQPVAYTFSMLLLHVCSFCTAVPCLLIPQCCAMSTFSMVLRHNFFYNTASPYLLFPCCCAVYTFSTLLRPFCCAIAALSTLLRYVYFFHAATLCLLRYVYSFHHAAAFYLIKGAALYLIFPCCYAMTTFFTLFRHNFFFKRCCAKTTFFHSAAL